MLPLEHTLFVTICNVLDDVSDNAFQIEWFIY